MSPFIPKLWKVGRICTWSVRNLQFSYILEKNPSKTCWDKHTSFGTSIDIIFKLVYAILAMCLAILAIWISYILYSFFSFYNLVLWYFSFISDVYWLDRPDSPIFKWYFAEISKLQKGAKRPHCNFDFMN